MTVKIVKKGNRIKIQEAALFNTWAAMYDRNRDLIIFYRPDYKSGGETHKTLDGQITVLDGEIQSIALYGPKVLMIEGWLRDQIEEAGLDDEYTL